MISPAPRDSKGPDQSKTSTITSTTMFVPGASIRMSLPTRA
jgi:hypothetical protein